jgi:hypothetical protein
MLHQDDVEISVHENGVCFGNVPPKTAIHAQVTINHAVKEAVGQLFL